MEKNFSLRTLFIKILLLLPLAYIGLGWYIGLNYASKPLIFGPYPDIPVVSRTSILGRSIEKISGGDIIVTLAPVEKDSQQDSSSAYFNINGYFEVPGSWFFDFPPAYEKTNYPWKKSFLLTGDFFRASGHELKNPEYDLGYYSLSEFREFLQKTNRTQEIERLKPYLYLSQLEARHPWFYSESVFLSTAMGKVFKDNLIPYDMLGLFGIGVLFIALFARSIGLWMYYLYWVFAYWFGRIGFHDPNLIMSNEGWQVIKWSFWHRFICNEGRIFLVVSFVLSVIFFAILGYLYLIKHVIPRKKREIEDFLKVDKDAQKRKELSIENIVFKDIHYDINRKLSQYAHTDKYFLGLTDDKKDVVVEEKMLNQHLHILGPTGSGKTSLAILPLSRQALEKQRGCCFIDFKGDEVFKKYVQQKAKEKGKKFYYFSIDSNEPSIGYNPLSSGDIHSKVDRIMSALELMYQGPASFYSNVQTMSFVKLLNEMVKIKDKINFESVKDALGNQDHLDNINADPQELRGLFAAIAWIAEVQPLNRDELDLREVIKAGDVVFFALKSQVNTRLAEAIGRMLIIDLKFQAVLRKETDPPYFIFIDEFQNLSCTHFVDVISKVRSANFCLVLSNQSRGNLLCVSSAFENAIFTNTATKIIFTQEDPNDARFWAEKTGETTYDDKSVFQVDATSGTDQKTNLDGLRSAKGSIHVAKKNYISQNVFLRLPFHKSVVFSRDKLAAIANHEFLFDKKERDRIILEPFKYDF